MRSSATTGGPKGIPPDSVRFDAVLFDLLTALIDSWSLWNSVAGSDELGLAWRKAYLRLTYGAGAYRPYEDIVAAAAEEAGLDPSTPAELVERWGELRPWPEVDEVVAQLQGSVRLGVVTNCSDALGRRAAALVSDKWEAVVTAEMAGFYKPRREPYALTLDAIGTAPARTLFVAGSAADVPGAAALGMTVYWHNRAALPLVGDAPPDFHEPSLEMLPEVVLGSVAR